MVQAAAIYAAADQEATAVAATTKRTFRVVDCLPSTAPICDMAGALAAGPWVSVLGV